MPEHKMLLDFPELKKQWDYDKNGSVSPSSLSAGSGFQAWWICGKGHSWRTSVNHRSHGTGCPYCVGRIVSRGETDLKTVYPDLAEQWNFERNGGALPENFHHGSHKKVWWRCHEGHEWQAVIASRAAGYGCPFCTGQRPISGVTDFSSVYPGLALEWDYGKNGDLTPSDICYGSNKRYWWKCDNGHSWQATAASRKRAGCPVCSGKKILAGYNDLLTVNPELAAEWDYVKNKIKPTQVTRGSFQYVWWHCAEGHSWKARIANRMNGRGCPFCSRKAVLSGENDLATVYPELSAEWNYEKNAPLLPSQVMPGSGRMVWWRCTDGHEWKASILMRKRGNGCPYCAGMYVIPGKNDLLSQDLELAAQWDYEKNQLRHDEVHRFSNTYAWWKCGNGHSWKAIIANRSNGKNCPYCSGQRLIPGINDLASVNPGLASQWDYDKNGELTPETVMANAKGKVWWKCRKGHSWRSTVASRNSGGNGCPYCYGRVQYVPKFMR